MANNKNKVIKSKPRIYTSRDFDGFRRDLLQYAKNYFNDQIQDFSDASPGGLLLDMAAFIGDNLSFYLDHQFNELDPLTAVETVNIQQHARNAGVKISGASPAVCEVRILIEVPAEIVPGTSSDKRPKEKVLPIIKSAGTELQAETGIPFTLTEDLDFAQKDKNGNLLATKTVLETASDGTPLSYILSRKVIAVSGRISTDSFTIEDTYQPFRQVTLSARDVSNIMYVRDTSGNDYYEVQNLTQDTVYKSNINYSTDRFDVPRTLEIIPAPRRYITTTNVASKEVTLQFGAGMADTFDDDIIPDPSELSLNLYGKKTFSRFSIDPNKLLDTKTLGISPQGTTITVSYRHGGGISHNVVANSIRTISNLEIMFRPGVSVTEGRNVRLSIDVNNEEPARGGATAPSIESVRSSIPFARSQQNRIVTREDLLARISSLPTEFGKAFRAGLRSTPTNPLSMSIYLVGRDVDGFLSPTSDTYKLNLRTYINDLRLVSDAFDVLDSPIINFGIRFNIIASPTSNKFDVVENVINRLKPLVSLRLMGIDKPLLESEFIQVILGTPDVISLVDFNLENLANRVENREYSDYVYDLEANKNLGLYFPPPGGIFEMRFPNNDIIGGVQ